MMKACFTSVGSLIKRPAKIEKKQIINYRMIVPQDFEENNNISEPSNPTTETNNRLSSFFNLSKKKDALPPVVSEVTTLLYDAETKESSSDFTKSIEILEKATTLGSASAASKLGLIYHGQVRSNVEVNYQTAATYYILAFKYIYMIPSEKWAMGLVLEVVAAFSDLYRRRLRVIEDDDIRRTGLNAMKHIELILQDSTVIKNFTHRDLQKSKAARIHINFCLGLKSEVDSEFPEAISYFETCRRIGECNFTTADKLVRKSQSKIRNLDCKIPSSNPICVICNHEAKLREEIWALQICGKCQKASVCSRKCLNAHFAAEHAN